MKILRTFNQTKVPTKDSQEKHKVKSGKRLPSSNRHDLALGETSNFYDETKWSRWPLNAFSVCFIEKLQNNGGCMP